MKIIWKKAPKQKPKLGSHIVACYKRQDFNTTFFKKELATCDFTMIKSKMEYYWFSIDNSPKEKKKKEY